MSSTKPRIPNWNARSQLSSCAKIGGNSEEGERAAAALNHLNIATIHAIEEVEPAPVEAVGELFIVSLKKRFK